MKKHILMPVLLSALVAGCASKQEPAPVDPVLLALQSMASDIKQELILISERQQVEAPDRVGAKGTNEAFNEKVGVFDYEGDIEGALGEITRLVDYHFEDLRTSPFPVTVVIYEKDSSIFDLVRIIGAQAGSRVKVVVSERYRQIRLEDG